MRVNAPIKLNEPIEVKRSTEVNFKYGGGQLSLFSHFRNNGTTLNVHTSTSPDPVGNAMLLELKTDGSKGSGRDRRFLVGLTGVFGEGLIQACAGYKHIACNLLVDSYVCCI